MSWSKYKVENYTEKWLTDKTEKYCFTQIFTGAPRLRPIGYKNTKYGTDAF